MRDWLTIPFAVGIVTFSRVYGVVNDSFPPWLLRLMVAVSTGVAAGLVAHAVRVGKRSKPLSQQDRFARDAVEEARALHDDGRHLAVVDFRKSASESLQLLGEWPRRVELGEIALRSARGEGDRLAQASILIDDIGYSTFEAKRDAQSAMASIEDGIAVLNGKLDDPSVPMAQRDQLLELRAKARRHLAAIKPASRDFEGARSVLRAAWADAERISEPLRVLALAKLDYADGYVLDAELTARDSAGGQAAALDEPTVCQLEGVIHRCRTAITTFREHGNLEWEARTTTLLPKLLRRCAPDWEVLEAEVQAEMIRQLQARHQ